MEYQRFIESKSRINSQDGFEPNWIPKWLKDFQKYLVDWACKTGRSAIFADCGMGKTPMQLVWAKNVCKHTGGRVLIVTPLAVYGQTKREADKFKIESEISRDGKYSSDIVLTNYERLHYFSPEDFAGVVCDESSAIKDFKAKRTSYITEFMRQIKYRLLCTATPAPNDFHELGTSSESLGYLGFRDMITKFFKMEQSKDYLGWGRTKYRFRGHAQDPFWQWVCSWARSMRMPSDMGFSNKGFVLPPLIENNVIAKTAQPRPGVLYTTPARGMKEERQERNHSIRERCEISAELINAVDGPAVAWCELNPEGDLLAKLIDDCVQIKGSQSPEEKEEKFELFATQKVKKLVIKPKIGAWGLNWQHCSNMSVMISHSFEQYYQLVHRCWRFGQANPVTVNRILCEGQLGILDNLSRKQEQSEQMFDRIVRNMNDPMLLLSKDKFDETESIPSWLQRI